MSIHWTGKIFRQGKKFGVVFQSQNPKRTLQPGMRWDTIADLKAWAGAQTYLGNDDKVTWIEPEEARP